MARSTKLFFRMTGLVLGVVLAFNANETDFTAEAGSNTSYLNSLNGGIAQVLDPMNKNGQSILEDALQNIDDAEEVVVEEEKELVMANVKSALNIRAEATLTSAKVGKLYKDCAGTILERKDGWTKIQSGNLIGWAKDSLLLFGEEAEKMANLVGVMVATVDADVLRVRTAPDAEASVYGVLAKDEIVAVVDDTLDGWVCVDYDGVDGYVSADYVSLELKLDYGETMEEINQKRMKKTIDVTNRNITYGEYLTDEETEYLLAALIQCEAGGEPYEGQVAVGAVVMNRVRSSAYPDNIPGVIYASGQFTPAMTGKLDRVYASGQVRESCIQAAKEALSGVSNVGDLTHFRRNDGRVGLVIGNHVFH